MLFRKLREIKRMLFTRKPHIRVIETPSPTEKIETPSLTPSESLEKLPITKANYLRQKLLTTQKRYFDSADHFLEIYEMEQRELQQRAEHIATPQTPSTLLDTDCASAAAPAGPLEAYTEIIDEMKPKESV